MFLKYTVTAVFSSLRSSHNRPRWPKGFQVG